MYRTAHVAALAAAGMMATLAAPAHALEHRVIIEHPEGPVQADYTGTTRLETRQAGTPAPGGRSATLRCHWSVSLAVERTAAIGATLQARRSMTQGRVLNGSVPGRCEARREGIWRMVEARRPELRTAMMAMVAQDRDMLLVEASQSRARPRES